MDEKALNHSFELFKADGYNGTLDQYKSLISNNQEARAYSYELFSKDGYDGTPDDFIALIDVGNQEDPANVVATAGSKTQMQQNTESKSENGLLESEGIYKRIFNSKEEEVVVALNKMYEGNNILFEESNFATNAVTDNPLQVFNFLDAVKVSVPGTDKSISLSLNAQDKYTAEKGIKDLENFIEQNKSKIFLDSEPSPIKKATERYKQIERDYRSSVSHLLNFNFHHNFGDVDGGSLEEKINNGLAKAIRKKIKSRRSLSGKPTDEGIAVPSHVQDVIINEEINKVLSKKLQTKRANDQKFINNLKATGAYEKTFDYYKNSYIIPSFNEEEKKLAEALRINDSLKSKLRNTELDIEERRKLELELKNNSEALEKLSKTYLENEGRDFYIDTSTGEPVGTIEAEDYEGPMVSITEEAAKIKKQYQNFNREALEKEFMVWGDEKADLEKKLNKVVPVKTHKLFLQEGSVLGAALEDLGYKAREQGASWENDQNNIGTYDVKIKDLLKVYHRTGLGEEKISDAIERAYPKFDTPQILQDYDGYFKNIDKEIIELEARKKALKEVYFLNLDPASNDADFLDGTATFAKEALVGITNIVGAGEIIREALPDTRREELDDLQNLMQNTVQITKEQEEAFDRGIGMQIAESGGIVGDLVQFAVLNKAAGAAGITRLIANVSSRNKVAGTALKLLQEELNFQVVTRGEAPTGEGAFFGLGSMGAVKLLPKFKGNFQAFNAAYLKTVGGGVGMTGGSEVAAFSHAVADHLLGNKAMQTSLKEQYGDMDEATARLVVNFITGTGIGFKGLRAKDFKSMAYRVKLYSKIEKEILEGKYSGVELNKKSALLNDLKQDISLAYAEYNKMDLGSRFKEYQKAKEVIESGVIKYEVSPLIKEPKSEPATKKQIKLAKRIVSEYEADQVIAEKKIRKSYAKVVKALDLKPDKVGLIINRGEGMDPSNKAELTPDNKIKINLDKYRPGVFEQEVGHLFMRLAFKNSPDVAKKFVNKIKDFVAEKNIRIKSKEGESISFEEAINEFYKDNKSQIPEEYIMNLVEFLSKPEIKNVLLKEGFLQGLRRETIATAEKIGLTLDKKTDFTNAADLLEFLYNINTSISKGSARSIKARFKQFENLKIDGQKLVDLTSGKEVVDPNKAEGEMLRSIDMESTSNKDIFTKAEKAYEEYKNNVNHAGLMVGMEFDPIVRKMLKKYSDLFGMDAETFENIVSDVTIETRPGYNGVPALVKSWDPSKGASLTSHIYGNLPKRILGIIQNKYPQLGRTVSLESSKAENIEAGESLSGGGFVDVSSPEVYTRVSQKKAEKVLELSESYAEKAAKIGERILMANKLVDLDAKAVGKIKAGEGKYEGQEVRVAMLESNRARLYYPDGTEEVIKARSPKVVEIALNAPEKSFVKMPTTKDSMVADAKDYLMPELEKEAGGLQDNYTPTERYTKFVDNAFPLYKSYLSQSAINKRFADFKDPVIDPKTGKQRREKTAAGNKIFTKKSVSLAEWRKYFIGDGTFRIDGRRRSLLEALATEQGFDKVMETLISEGKRKAIEERQEDLGVNLADNYLALLSKKLDRGMSNEMASKDMQIVEASDISGIPAIEIIEYLARANKKAKGDYFSVKTYLPEEYRNAINAGIEIVHLREILAEIDNKTNANETTKGVLKQRGYNTANLAPLTSQNKEQFKNSIKSLNHFYKFVPAAWSNLSIKGATRPKKKNSLLARLTGFGGWSNRALKEPLNRNQFENEIAKGIGTEFENLKNSTDPREKDLYEKVIKLNSKIGNRGSLDIELVAIKEFASEVRRNSKSPEEVKKKLLNYERLDEFIKESQIRKEFFSTFLEILDYAGTKIKGEENLKNYKDAVASMFLSNDPRGFRDFSTKNVFDTTPGARKLYDQHAKPRVLMGAEIIEAIGDGVLSTSINKIMFDYESVYGLRAAQRRADKVLNPTAQGSIFTKIGSEQIVYKGENKNDISKVTASYLKRYLDVVSSETLYDRLLKEKTNEIAIEADVILKKGLQTPIGVLKGANPIELASKAIELDSAIEKAKDPNKKVKGISVFDFDDTLAKTKSNVLYTLPNGFKGKLNATEFAKRSAELENKGAKFDFSEFSKVIKAELGPLFEEAKKKAGKYTTKDIFVLTARTPESAKAIHEYLKSEGLEVPLENITGLGDGRAEAKAEWMVEKVNKGYNDFYFADDAIKNVEAVKNALNVFDVKSDVQQAIMASKNIDISLGLAEMIERKKGVPADKIISEAVAFNEGRKKGRFSFYLPPNAEDFQGMLYKFYGKGKQGEADMAFMQEKLLRPYGQGELAITTYKQNLAADLKAMEKQLRESKTKMNEESKKILNELGFNADQAVRVSIWQGEGYEIPGVSNLEAAKLTRTVLKDKRLRAYAEGIKAIVKTPFPEPSATWFSSNIKYDLFKHASEGSRKSFMSEFSENVDAMFTKDNLNKIEAAYGRNFRANLETMITRMKTGKSRKEGISKEVDAALDYINGSVGVIMWMNTRSALLQTISAVNYINLSDNNPLAVAKTLTKPIEFAKTFKEIFNSDFLKQRRDGLELNIEEAEIAKAVEQSKGKATHLFNLLIKAGFKPTQIADSFAIAIGGTPLYINRTKTYMKQGLSEAAAKKKAFEDFREISEENQQSSKMDRVSNIQTGMLGRIVFAFNNTPMQMTRIQKKAALDLINRRGDWKTNVSKLVYYGFIQQVIFYALQQATALTLFGEDDENLTPEQVKNREAFKEKKGVQLANSVTDAFFSGSGMPGKLLVTGKNTLASYIRESEKGYRAEPANVINEALSISPPLSSKLKKGSSALKAFKYYSTKKGQAELASQNQLNPLAPVNMARAKVISAATNVPVDRLLQKTDHLVTAIGDEELDTHLRLALAMGWDKWSLGFYDDLYFNEKDSKKLTSTDRSKVMKEYWKKRKAKEKKERDSIRNLEGNMTMEEYGKYINQKKRSKK